MDGPISHDEAIWMTVFMGCTLLYLLCLGVHTIITFYKETHQWDDKK